MGVIPSTSASRRRAKLFGPGKHTRVTCSQEAFFFTGCLQMVSLSIRSLERLRLTPHTLKRREVQPTWRCLISKEQQGWAERTQTWDSRAFGPNHELLPSS